MKFFLFILLVFFLASWSDLFGQKILTADEAYDYVQSNRNKASNLIDTNTTRAQIEKGIALLKRSLIFLDSIPIKTLAKTDIYLYYRRADVYYDLSVAYSLYGKKDSALNYLNNY